MASTYTSLGLAKVGSMDVDYLLKHNVNMDVINALLIGVVAGQNPTNITNLAAFAARLDNFIANVKDQGAVGDGATEESSVFVAAEAAHTFNFVPEGDYILDDYIPGSGFFGPGVCKISVEGGTRRDFYLPSSPGVWKPITNLGEIKARMANGEAIKIACYGDSTTDGNNTTDHTANPTTEVTGEDWAKEPVEDSADHNITAPNAYPAKLQVMLRDIYRNTSIEVWNCGYSGQHIRTGFANTFVERAILNNSNYGLPNIIVVAFGLNDFATTTEVIASFKSELEKLLRHIIGYGALPIVLACDPNYRQAPGNLYKGTGAERETEESSRVCDEIKKAVCEYYHVPYFAIDLELKNYIAQNDSNHSWIYLQSDYLHFGDDGHDIKAGALARFLVNDCFDVKGDRKVIIDWQDSRSGWPFKADASYSPNSDLDPTASRSDAYWNLYNTTDWIGGEHVYDCLIYAEVPCTLIYRGPFSNTNLTAIKDSSVDTFPVITVDHCIDWGTPYYNKPVPGSGLRSVHHALDRPLTRIPVRVGLNRLRLTLPTMPAGADRQLWGGYFEVNPFWKNANTQKGFHYVNTSLVSSELAKPYWETDALAGLRPFYWEVDPEVSGAQIYSWAFPEAKDGSNVLSVSNKFERGLIYVEGEFSRNTGFVFLSGRSSDLDYTTSNSFERSLFVYFSSAVIRLYELGGPYDYTELLEIASNPWTSSSEIYQVKMKIDIWMLDDHYHQIRLFDGWENDAAVLGQYVTSSSHPYLGYPAAVPFAGTVGGGYIYQGTSVIKRVHIKNMFIHKYDNWEFTEPVE